MSTCASFADTQNTKVTGQKKRKKKKDFTSIFKKVLKGKDNVQYSQNSFG